MLNPRVLEKLLKHFSKNLKITVTLDYSPNAGAHTDEKGNITLPAWLDEKDAGKLLACVLHESGHAEFDLDAIQRVRLYGGIPAFNIVHNAAADVRIDSRRLKQYSGAMGLYKDIWEMAETAAKEKPPQPWEHFVQAIQGFISEAIGAGQYTPTLVGYARTYPNYDKIVERFKACATKDGSLWETALEIIDLLQVKQQKPQPQQGQQGQGQGQGQGQDVGDGTSGSILQEETPTAPQEKTLKSELERCDNTRTRKNIEAKLGNLADMSKKIEKEGLSRQAKRDISKAQASLGRSMPNPSVVNKACNNIPGQSWSLGRGDQHIHPASLEDIKLTPVNVEEYNRTCMQAALSKFFESTEETLGDPEIKHKIDTQALARVVTHPNEILIGDEETIGEDTIVSVLVDCSSSMLSGIYDGKGRGNSKIDLAVQTLKTVLENAKSNNAIKVRLGVVLFSCDTVELLPLTPIQEIDLSHVTANHLDKKISFSGTDLRAGLEHSLKTLEEERARQKAVIVITDGEVVPRDAAFIKNEWPSDIRIGVTTISDRPGAYAMPDPDLAAIFRHRCHSETTMPIALSESLSETD